jgi:tetratricopeptide (TPR) repeat protein
MRFFLMSRMIVVVVATSLFVACSDPVTRARKEIQRKPENAIKILSEALQKNQNCFDCAIFLGLACEVTKDYQRAAEAYEMALKMPDASFRQEPVRDRLLLVYGEIFKTSTDKKTKEEVATKAANLEKSLAVQKVWANEYLANEHWKAFEGFVRKGMLKEAQEEAQKVMGLYLSRQKKEEFARQATQMLQDAFAKKVVDTVLQEMDSDEVLGRFVQKEKKNVRLINEYVVPNPRSDPQINPDAQDFMMVVRSRACLPLREDFGKVVGAVAGKAGINRALSDEEVNRLFAVAYTYATAGFKAIDGERIKIGQPFVCFIEMPLEALARELYAFSQ